MKSRRESFIPSSYWVTFLGFRFGERGGREFGLEYRLRHPGWRRSKRRVASESACWTVKRQAGAGLPETSPQGTGACLEPAPDEEAPVGLWIGTGPGSCLAAPMRASIG